MKGNQDFAAGLSKSADKANNSAKALKNTLMGFDEINKLDDDSGSGGSGGSGGGGSAGSFDMQSRSRKPGQKQILQNLAVYSEQRSGMH